LLSSTRTRLATSIHALPWAGGLLAQGFFFAPGDAQHPPRVQKAEMR
jgi:hypothetical protein